MARPCRAFTGTERLDEEVRCLGGDVQQRGLSGAEMVRNGRLEQVPEVVELVAVVALEDPARRARPAMRFLRVDRSRGVDVAVRLLRGGDLRNQAVDIGVQLRIGIDVQRVRRAFNDFVQVGVVERVARRARVFELLTAERLGRALEVIDALGALALLKRRRDRDLPVRLDPRRPEHVVQVHAS